MGFPKGATIPLVKGGVKSPPAKCPRLIVALTPEGRLGIAKARR